MQDLYTKKFNRNIGLITDKEQERIRHSVVAVAGVGGVGGLLAERLIRLGIGKIKITDPGTFEESNLNRQFGSSMLNLGENKAEVIFTHLKDINPEAEIIYCTDGIYSEEAAEILVGDCDVIVDEMDAGLFRESILLQRTARENGNYYLFTSAYGFGAIVVIFDPRGLTLEEYNGLSPDIDVNDAEKLSVPTEKVVPVMPSYISSIDAGTIQKMMDGEIPAPTISIGAGLASVLAAGEVINIILKRREVVTAPRYTYIDLLDQKFLIGSITR